MGFNDSMSKTTARMSARKSDMRARLLDRQRRRLDRQVDGLKAELDHEREERRKLAGLMEEMEDHSMREGHGTMRLLVVGGIAYVLGAKAGRGRYDQIMTKGREIRDRVRETTKSAGETDQASAPIVDTVRPPDLSSSSTSKRLATGTE
jgi:hypothetical protein